MGTFLLLMFTISVPTAMVTGVHLPGDPPPICTAEIANNINNLILSVTASETLSTSVEKGARNVALGGSKNHIGDDINPIVDALVVGCEGSVRHSTSALFAYANRPVSSRYNHEFRVVALNGAHFEDTRLMASALLLRDDESMRMDETTLASYLSGIGSNATAMLSMMTMYRYRWNSTYSPENRWRYGMRPSEATDPQDPACPTWISYAIESSSPPVFLSQSADVCQLDTSGSMQSPVISATRPSVDIMSMIALIVESIKEMDARLQALEP